MDVRPILTLRTIPVSIACTVWARWDIVLICLVSSILHKQADAPVILGIGPIADGVAFSHGFSKSIQYELLSKDHAGGGFAPSTIGCRSVLSRAISSNPQR